MPSVFIQPFDFQTIYINYFLGSSDLFVAFFVILVSFLSAYMNISGTVFLTILVLGLILFGSITGQILYTLILFIAGFILYKMFTRLYV